MSRGQNGFELAEKDLKTRGLGRIFRPNPPGMPDLAMVALQNPGDGEKFLAKRQSI